MIIVDVKDDIPNEKLIELYENWQRLKPEGLPYKSNLNQEVFGNYGPFCKLSVIEKEPFRIKYEAVGEAVQALYNAPLENQYLDELFDPWIRAQVITTYKTCYEKKSPVYEKKGIATIVGKIGYEYIILPFASDEEEEVSAFLSCVFPLDMSIGTFNDWKESVSMTPWLNNQ
jgi:hypothetical protein